MAVGDLVKSGYNRSGEWASAINRIANLGGISFIKTIDFLLPISFNETIASL